MTLTGGNSTTPGFCAWSPALPCALPSELVGTGDCWAKPGDAKIEISAKAQREYERIFKTHPILLRYVIP